MKPLLHLILAAGLILQGALAVAMPVTMAAPSAQASMPCHGEHSKKSMPCCAHAQCACQAICSAIALPIAIANPAAVMSAPQPAAPREALARTAFRLTPLRPPIDLSA